MDLNTVQERVRAVETMLSGNVGPAADRRKVLCTRELDRLAETLIGEQANGAQDVKNRIQLLLTQLAPQRSDAMAYIEMYCQGLRL